MQEEIEKLPALHDEVESLLSEFTEQKSFESRLELMKKAKPYIAKYFKASEELSTFLTKASKDNEHVATTLRRYTANREVHGKKVIDLYLTYGHGCESSQQLKFQIALAEAHALLMQRIKIEQKHLLPEYRSLF